MNLNLSWHSESSENILKALETDKDSGLSSREYLARLKKFGLNEIKEKKRFKFLKLLLRQFENPLVLILVIAGFFSVFFLKNFQDGIIIFIAVFINTAIGVFQEGHASRIFENLINHIKPAATVIRNGEQKDVSAATLVPGDIVILRSGAKMPADGRIIEEYNLEINESVLTGEWEAQRKETRIISIETPLQERKNMAYAGTLVENGWAKMAIVATGEKTEFGKIVYLLEKEKTGETPVQKGVKNLARLVGAAVLIGVLIIFILGILKGEQVKDMFILGIAVAVAAVPEGLPAAVSVILAVGMKRILRKNGLVKRLISAEGLGSADVILTDKTGTLTEAKMEFSRFKTAGRVSQDLKSAALKDDPEAMMLFKTAVLANNAFIEKFDTEFTNIIVRGRPTDRALLLSGLKAGLDIKELFKTEPRLDFMPFHSERRISSSLHYINENASRLYVSGEPEKILKHSQKIFKNGDIKEFSNEEKDDFLKSIHNFAKNGERVVACAYKEERIKNILAGNKETFENLIFCGIIAFEDPLRFDTKEAVQRIKAAGVRVAIMTGDHPETARRVAEKLEIGDSEKPLKIILGSEVENASAGELREFAREADVFARILPQHKMRIVEAFQQNGFNTAMIGDGVNDVLALKKANIGVALGSGTDTAKESSDLILLNDAFSIIVLAIEEGRIIVDNLRKAIIYLLATSFSEIILIGGALVAGLPLPLLPAQIIWLNIVGEGFMTFAFAFEPKEEDIHKQKPSYYSLNKFLSANLAKLILIIGLTISFSLFGFYILMQSVDYEIEKIRTIIFSALAMSVLFFAFSVKAIKKPLWRINIFSNSYLIGSWFISLLLLLLALFFNPLQKVLQLSDLSAGELGIIFLFGLLNLFVIEAVKLFINRKNAFKI